MSPTRAPAEPAAGVPERPSLPPVAHPVNKIRIKANVSPRNRRSGVLYIAPSAAFPTAVKAPLPGRVTRRTKTMDGIGAFYDSKRSYKSREGVCGEWR